MEDLQLHPLCTLFPRITGIDFEYLRADIAANGLREPIVVHEGMILDGGNRYRACLEAGVEPNTKEFDGDNLVSFVLSANLHRRHLTPGQAAAIVASATDWQTSQSRGRPEQTAPGSDLNLSTVADRAAASGASVATQRRADAVTKAAPELSRQVASGEITLAEAVKVAAPQLSQRKVAQDDPAPNAPDDAPDLVQLADELMRENEAYQRQIQSLDADDPKAELVRLNLHLDQLNGRLQGEITTRNEAQKQAKYYAGLLERIRKALKVESNRDILAALEAR